MKEEVQSELKRDDKADAGQISGCYEAFDARLLNPCRRGNIVNYDIEIQIDVIWKLVSAEEMYLVFTSHHSVIPWKYPHQAYAAKDQQYVHTKPNSSQASKRYPHPKEKKSNM